MANSMGAARVDEIDVFPKLSGSTRGNFSISLPLAGLIAPTDCESSRALHVLLLFCH